MASIPYNSQLDAFELYHRIQEEESRTETGSGLGLPALGHALAGSAGTAISHLILYPLDLSITRLQVQKQLQGASNSPPSSPTRKSPTTEANEPPASLLSIIRTIYKTEGGIRAFYSGCALDTAKSIVDAFLFFLLYTYFRTRRLTASKSRNLSVPDELRIGIQAGLLSKLATTPISQLVTRRQVASGKKSPPSLAQIAKQIYRERGPTGFWAGYRASIILTLNPALTFLFQNTLSKALLRAEKRQDPGPKITFLIAAVSKAAASAVMYPFSLAKTRAQLAASGPKAVDATPVPGRNPAVEQPGKAGEKTTVERTVAFVVEQVKKPSPVVQSLKHVYATEGLGALYAGLEGEVLKGFLGHGLTMLLKERIHVAVVAGYFLALKLARQSKDGSRGLGEDVAEEMGKMARVVSEVVESVGEKVAGA